MSPHIHVGGGSHYNSLQFEKSLRFYHSHTRYFMVENKFSSMMQNQKKEGKPQLHTHKMLVTRQIVSLLDRN